MSTFPTLLLASILVTRRAQDIYICQDDSACSDLQDSILPSLTAVCDTDTHYCTIECPSFATCSAAGDLIGISGLECDSTKGWCKLASSSTTTLSPTSSPITENTESQQSISNDDANMVIILVVLGLIVVCILVIFIILIIFRRKKQKNDKIVIEIVSDGINSVSENDVPTKSEEINKKYEIVNISALPPTQIALMKWLIRDCGLKQYFDLFVKNGYESLDFIKEIDASEQLAEIGIELPGHRHKIWKEIQKLKETGTEIHKEGIEGIDGKNENETIPIAVDGENENILKVYQTTGNEEIGVNIGDGEFIVKMDDDNIQNTNTI